MLRTVTETRNIIEEDGKSRATKKSTAFAPRIRRLCETFAGVRTNVCMKVRVARVTSTELAVVDHADPIMPKRGTRKKLSVILRAVPAIAIHMARWECPSPMRPEETT